MMRRPLLFAMDLLYSEKCSLCGDLLTPDRNWNYPLCAECTGKFKDRSGSLCSACSTDLVSERDVCTRCRDREYAFTSNYSLFVYRDDIRQLISQYKTKNVKSLAGFFAVFFAKAISEKYPDFTVVPVPFRLSRKRSRGWDQIEAICDVLHRTYAIKSLKILKRKGSSAQKTLNYSGRLANLEGNISIKNSAAAPEKALLVDDVFTTGATADVCAKTLLRAGTREVKVLSIALDQ